MRNNLRSVRWVKKLKDKHEYETHKKTLVVVSE